MIHEPPIKWYLVQYHKKKKKVARLIDKAWFPGFAFAGSILPDARFDVRIGNYQGSEDIFINCDMKTQEYIQNTLLADCDKWCEKAGEWVVNIGVNDLIPHDDYIEKNWMGHGVMLVRPNLQWFWDNDIQVYD